MVTRVAVASCDSRPDECDALPFAAVGDGAAVADEVAPNSGDGAGAGVGVGEGEGPCSASSIVPLPSPAAPSAAVAAAASSVVAAGVASASVPGEEPPEAGGDGEAVPSPGVLPPPASFLGLYTGSSSSANSMISPRTQSCAGGTALNDAVTHTHAYTPIHDAHIEPQQWRTTHPATRTDAAPTSRTQHGCRWQAGRSLAARSSRGSSSTHSRRRYADTQCAVPMAPLQGHHPRLLLLSCRHRCLADGQCCPSQQLFRPVAAPRASWRRVSCRRRRRHRCRHCRHCQQTKGPTPLRHKLPSAHPHLPHHPHQPLPLLLPLLPPLPLPLPPASRQCEPEPSHHRGGGRVVTEPRRQRRGPPRHSAAPWETVTTVAAGGEHLDEPEGWPGEHPEPARRRLD